MTEKELSEMTDEKLMKEAKKIKSNAIINAFLVGFLIAIVIWSAINSTTGLLTLIPLYFIHKLVNNSGDDKAVVKLLKERNLN